MPERVSSSAAYTSGGLCALVGSWTANEIAMYFGMFIAGLTYLTNLYYQRKRDKREERLLYGDRTASKE